MAKDKTKKTIVLLDTHAIIHRAYHALPDFMNSREEPTGALYGLTTMLFKIIGDLHPDYVVACYDLPKKTFRHEAYDDYKAGRAKTDEALISQIIRSREFYDAFSIPYYECEGFEADDLLGTIAENIKGECDVIIASGDMDTLQLVDGDRVRVYTLKKGINDTILYNEKQVLERFNFKPEFLPDYKGLRGDPSDNIIGIKGIGEKTATTLISKYGTIEKMYKMLSVDFDELKKQGITERIFGLLKDGEDEAIFSKTLATIRRDAPIDFKIPGKTWSETVDAVKLKNFLQDLEFKSLNSRVDKIIYGEENKKQEILEDDKKEEVDATELEKAKIAFWLLNSDISNPNLEDIVRYKNSRSFDEAFSLIKKDIQVENLTYVYENIELPIMHIIKSMEERGITVDREYLLRLSTEYHKELNVLEKDIYKLSGIEFNVNSPKQLGEVLFDQMKIHEGSGVRMKKTAGGSRSTKESELEKYKDGHPIVPKILEYRELQKLLSTYIDSLPNMIGSDGRIHAKFIQAGTTTGRFSSSDPNLQNIPIKTQKGKNIRYAFVASDGYKLASFDYSQVELRVAALLSQDEYFLNTFKQGRDIHTAVAMKVFNVPEGDVTSDMRRRAKVINFGILYGMGVTALRENLGGDRKEAQVFYDNYFAQFPTIAGYLESIKNFAKAKGYTETLFGRRRYFPGIKSHIPFIKAMAERMATNAPIQGTATADIVKIGMKNVDKDLRSAGLSDCVHLLLQVHDELIFEIKDDCVDKAKSVIKNAMENAIPDEFLNGMNSVPLEVSCDIGKNWGELK
jgi:DNA polymerase-1